MIITIDGPCASGKSSVAKKIAERLGIFHFSTGLLYRAVAYLLTNLFHAMPTDNHGYDLSLIDYSFIDELHAVVQQQSLAIFFKSSDITAFLSDDSLSLPASVVSAVPQVRARLLKVQQAVGAAHDIVVDGRDCGTIVFPAADWKFYLTASVDARARRIMADPKRVAFDKTYEQIQQEIIQRDAQDTTRSIAPLVMPQGACVIDNSDMTLEETVDDCMMHIQTHQAS